jgi:hypothetical protein
VVFFPSDPKKATPRVLSRNVCHYGDLKRKVRLTELSRLGGEPMFKHPSQRRETVHVVALAALVVGYLAVLVGLLLLWS